MPLHDWTELSGWEGVHQIWMVELLYWLQPRLPAGYRAYIGTTPTFAIDASAVWDSPPARRLLPSLSAWANLRRLAAASSAFGAAR